MSSSNVGSPPIPRRSIGRTFAVAVTVLGIFGALQILAVVWHFLPLVGQQVAETATARRLAKAEAAETPAPQPYRPQPKAPSAAETKALGLVAEADKRYRVGEFEQSLQFLEEAQGLLPGDRRILFRQAQAFDRLDRYEEAAIALQALLKYPDLPDAVRQQGEKKLQQYASSVKASPASSAAPMSEATAVETDSSSTLRDEVGLQPGASLGIVDARLRDGDAGKKVLRVSIKARRGFNVAWDDFQLYIYFYESTPEGEVVLTESQVPWQWVTPPIDWKEDEPEVVDMEYTLPAETGGAAGRKFVGYVVGVYYNRELQDSRADPGSLDKQYPMPLYLKFNEDGQ